MRLKPSALLAGLALAAGLGLGLGLARPAEAQGRAPYGAERYAEPGSSSARNVAGQFEYYALVLSWSPTHCSEVAYDHRDDMQCARRDGRRYAFVLHGLWPQYENGFPESCPVRGRNYVPRPVIDDMLDIMPAPGLVIHEYKKHGTCSGLEPQAYFAMARKLYRTVKVPAAFTNPFETQSLTPNEIETAFLAANPELKPDMIAVACGGQGGRLKEIRICFSKEGQPRNCGRNEEQRRLCKASKVTVPPVRSTKR